jgi:hypothetical protein
MRELGPLPASGRDSEIFDYGPGFVLRRSCGGHSLQKDAMVMRYVAQQGYPVPRVHELSADGSELVNLASLSAGPSLRWQAARDEVALGCVACRVGCNSRCHFGEVIPGVSKVFRGSRAPSWKRARNPGAPSAIEWWPQRDSTG